MEGDGGAERAVERNNLKKKRKWKGGMWKGIEKGSNRGRLDGKDNMT